MGKILSAKECAELTLLHPGLGPRTFTLHEGATLADLLRAAGLAIHGPNIMIDGRPIEEAMVLKSGMVITVLPELPQAPSEGSWRDTVGMFADDPDFEAMVEAGRAIREADRKSTLEELDREDAAREDT
jgi:sulfur carrier protein ThiS